MFQVVVQSAMRLMKSKKFRLPAPPTNASATDKKNEYKDKTGLILILMIGGGILLLAMFSNLPSN